jgi:FkbM family methyltransferase
MATVLFVCLHNTGRSQMSQAIFEHTSSNSATTPPQGKTATPSLDRVKVVSHGGTSSASARAALTDTLRNAIDRFDVLRRMVKSPAGQHLVQTTRGALLVNESLRFAAHQLGPASTAAYKLRGSGVRVVIRHDGVIAARQPPSATADVAILNEIFGGTGGQHAYEPPPALAGALDANPPRKVIDLGGNIGLFGAYVLSRWPGASLHSFEPDPANLRVLNRVVSENALDGRWIVTDAAVANQSGQMTFIADLFAESHLATDAIENGHSLGDASGMGESTADGHAITVRAVDFFDEDHNVDLLKMDIEGGEWQILTDPRFSSLEADVLVLEWHALGCPESNAHAAATRFVQAAGYNHLEDVEVGTYNGVLWAWRDEPTG